MNTKTLLATTAIAVSAAIPTSDLHAQKVDTRNSACYLYNNPGYAPARYVLHITKQGLLTDSNHQSRSGQPIQTAYIVHGKFVDPADGNGTIIGTILTANGLASRMGLQVMAVVGNGPGAEPFLRGFEIDCRNAANDLPIPREWNCQTGIQNPQDPEAPPLGRPWHQFTLTQVSSLDDPVCNIWTDD